MKPLRGPEEADKSRRTPSGSWRVCGNRRPQGPERGQRPQPRAYRHGNRKRRDRGGLEVPPLPSGGAFWEL